MSLQLKYLHSMVLCSMCQHPTACSFMLHSKGRLDLGRNVLRLVCRFLGMHYDVCIVLTTCNGELVVVDVVTDGTQLLHTGVSQKYRFCV